MIAINILKFPFVIQIPILVYLLASKMLAASHGVNKMCSYAKRSVVLY